MLRMLTRGMSGLWGYNGRRGGFSAKREKESPAAFLRILRYSAPCRPHIFWRSQTCKTRINERRISLFHDSRKEQILTDVGNVAEWQKLLIIFLT